MDLKEAIYSRRSVRDFTAEPVGEKAIRDLIEAAIQAPSAVNAQPCAFCVVRDKTVLAGHLAASESPYGEDDPGRTRCRIIFSEILNDAKFDIFYHAPALIPDFHRGGRPLGGGRLRARGRKPDACGLRRRSRNLLDWICAKLAEDARGQGAAEAPGELQTGGSDHCGTPQIGAAPVPRKEPEIRWVGA